MPDTITPLYYVCFLKKFNNYFNRIIKGYATLAEYESAVGNGNFYLYSKAINYNPNDSVSTELIMNDCPFDPDYLLILDSNGDIVARWFVLESIFTRNGQRKFSIRRDVIFDYLDKLMTSPVYVEKGWLKDTDPFIFNPEGMSFNEIKTDEILLKDNTNTAWIVGYIAQNTGAHNITLQQEAIIDYISLSTIASEMNISEDTLASLLNFNDVSTPSYFTQKVEIRYGTSESSIPPHVFKERLFFKPDFSSLISHTSEMALSWNKTLYKYKSNMFDINPNYEGADNAVIQNIITQASSIISGMTTTFERPYLTEDQLAVLRRYAGEGQKPILYNNIYYNLQVNVSGTVEDVSGPAIYTSFGGLSTALNNAAATPAFQASATFHNDGEISVRLTSQLAYIQMIEASTESTVPQLETKITTTRNKIQTQNFDMFCIPLATTSIKDDNSYDFKTKDNNTSLRIAGEIVRELASEIYDLQLLPYFPIPELINSGKIDISNLTEDNDYNFIKAYNTTAAPQIRFNAQPVSLSPDGQGYYSYSGNLTAGTDPWPSDPSDITELSLLSTSPSGIDIEDLSLTYETTPQKKIVISFKSTRAPVMPQPWIVVYVDFKYTVAEEIQSIIFWAKNNSFSTIIEKELSAEEPIKVEIECNKYRLCSPNYQGSFDFNLAKNGGQVNYFIAEGTYKPYTPYIKVAPDFSLLYGSNFGDARGLICGGDFSLPRLKDAWEEFELQNKNYQNIFNREIQNLDFTQELDYKKQLISGGLGILTGGAAGAGAGAVVGGGYGAIAGAAIGIAGSTVGMAIDTNYMVQQQREQRQLAIDKFNYQLGNIKALPYTITKIGSFTINSKIWPFVEFYTSTEEEKEALKQKLKYESMTVMRINLLGDYYRINNELHYFKGSLIRNEEIAEDNHVFEAIYDELLKGVYI